MQSETKSIVGNPSYDFPDGNPSEELFYRRVQALLKGIGKSTVVEGILLLSDGEHAWRVDVEEVRRLAPGLIKRPYLPFSPMIPSSLCQNAKAGRTSRAKFLGLAKLLGCAVKLEKEHPGVEILEDREVFRVNELVNFLAYYAE